jgi:hypothetical protein
VDVCLSYYNFYISRKVIPADTTLGQWATTWSERGTWHGKRSLPVSQIVCPVCVRRNSIGTPTIMLSGQQRTYSKSLIVSN